MPSSDTQFKPGNSGRPKGSRNKIAEDFLKDVHKDWSEYGAETLPIARAEKPMEYVKMVASLLPKELTVTHDSDLEAMETSELLAALVEMLDPNELEAAIERTRTGLE